MIGPQIPTWGEQCDTAKALIDIHTRWDLVEFLFEWVVEKVSECRKRDVG